ncbi:MULTISPECIES: hypothetical protein [unclassified Streptomyces]|uniref:hypothetical protein n=1 Tax=unclassified Streptomyces TaxID=2593676 RepID=UPI0019074E66|nr:hypothetical protein [Streptomyces sp. HSG2]
MTAVELLNSGTSLPELREGDQGRRPLFCTPVSIGIICVAATATGWAFAGAVAGLVYSAVG